jgi:hypothetical protein
MEHGEIVPESPIDLAKVTRTIVADKPRVTRFPIQWDGELIVQGQGQGQIEVQQQDEDCDGSMNVYMDMDSDSEECYTNGVPSLSSPKKNSRVQNSTVVSPEWSNQSGLMVE